MACAVTTVVSTAAIVGPPPSGVKAGDLLEGSARARARTRRARPCPRSGDASSGRSVKPSSSRQRPGSATTSPRRRARASPPGDGAARSRRTQPGSSSSRSDVSKLPAWPLHGPLDLTRLEEVGDQGGRSDDPVLARRLGDGGHARGRVAAVGVDDEDPPAARRGRRREQVAQHALERVDVERERPAEGEVVVRGPVRERRGEQDDLRPRRGLGGQPGHRLGDERIGAGCEMRPVLLGRADRDHGEGGRGERRRPPRA